MDCQDVIFLERLLKLGPFPKTILKSLRKRMLQRQLTIFKKSCSLSALGGGGSGGGSLVLCVPVI